MCVSRTITIREKATVIVDFDTWMALNKLNKELGLKNIDETIQYLIKENDRKRKTEVKTGKRSSFGFFFK
jgi:macrodomain Ter protein organizer (MatP/YcbG family)